MNDRQLLAYIENMERLTNLLERNERISGVDIKKLRDELAVGGNESRKKGIMEKLGELQKMNWENKGVESRLRSNLSVIRGPVSERIELAERKDQKTPTQRMREIFEEFFAADNNPRNREVVIAEIGGALSAWLPDLFPEFKHVYLSLYEDKKDDRVMLADITNCPHVPDESFDIIYSASVFEHVTEPWSAAREITRLLKPGGLTAHIIPFSFFYHESPIDFWRISPKGMEYLFPDLECVLSEFNSAYRRRNHVGSPENPIDKWGGSQFSVDAFGGWRENWFSLYAGIKRG